MFFFLREFVPRFFALLSTWTLLAGGNLLFARLLPFSIRPSFILTFCVSTLLILTTSGRSSIRNSALLLGVSALAGEVGSGLPPGSIFLVMLGVLLLLLAVGRQAVPTRTPARIVIAAIVCVVLAQSILVIVQRVTFSLGTDSLFRGTLHSILLPTLLAGPLALGWDLLLRRPLLRRVVLQDTGALALHEFIGRR